MTMNGQANPTTEPTIASTPPRRAALPARRVVLRALLPVFLVTYVALPIAVIRNSG